MHNIRDLARGRRGLTAARLGKPLSAALVAIGLVVSLSASAVAKSAGSAGACPVSPSSPPRRRSPGPAQAGAVSLLLKQAFAN